MIMKKYQVIRTFILIRFISIIIKSDWFIKANLLYPAPDGDSPAPANGLRRSAYLVKLPGHRFVLPSSLIMINDPIIFDCIGPQSVQ